MSKNSKSANANNSKDLDKNPNATSHLDEAFPEIKPWEADYVSQLKASISPTAVTTTNISKVYQHWANGDRAVTTDDEWNNNILSPNKSDYFEGEVIPHVFAYKASNNTPLENGKTYSFNITYNYYQENTNSGGFSYLTTYNSSVMPGNLSNGTPVADNDIFKLINGGGVESECQFYVSVDPVTGQPLANISSLSNVTYTGSGTKDGHVTVNFTYTGETTTTGLVEIYYGLYVAEPGSVPDQGQGETLGAHAWTGGSLQTTVDINGSGATSLQLMPSAIIVGEISGMKFNDMNGDGTRDADGMDNIAGNGDDEAGLAGWTIFIDTDKDGVLDAEEKFEVTDASGHYSFSVTPDANKATLENDGYVVREVLKDGWQQTTSNPEPIIITAADPTETGVNFGNMQMLPAIEVIKTGAWMDGNGDGDADVGEIIKYSFDVKNTGNVTLSNVTVSDPKITVYGGPTTLDVGETDSATFTGSYTITQADIDAGSVYNMATATGKDPLEKQVSDTDDNTAPLAQNPAINVIKTGAWLDGNGDGDADVGELINYTFDVSNTGNVTLKNVTVTDPKVTVTGGPTTLDVGEIDSATFTGSYAITQADIDAGSVYNMATATGRDPLEKQVSDTDDNTALLVQNPAINVVKTGAWLDGNGDGDTDVGELINYTFKVSNTGNVTLNNVTITDPKVTVTGGPTTLDVGEIDSATFTGSYAITQADIDAGYVYNMATATGKDPLENSVSDDDDDTVKLVLDPGLNTAKIALVVTDIYGNDLADKAGDIINYTIKVSNTGNQTLTGIVVTDDNADAQPVYKEGDLNGDEKLDINEVWTYTASYKVKQLDLDNQGGSDGHIDNIATADSNETEAVTAAAAVGLIYQPTMYLDKTVSSVTGGNGNTLADKAGDVINYDFKLSNTGNITLTDVTLSDLQVDAASLTRLDDVIGDDDDQLEVGEQWAYTAKYTLKQSDLDSNGEDTNGDDVGDGNIFNIATADSNETAPFEDSADVGIVYQPAMAVKKSVLNITGADANNLADMAGDVVHYTIQVKNIGNVTLTDIKVVDPDADLGSITRKADTVGDNNNLLEVGEIWNYSSAYTLTQDDLNKNGDDITGDGKTDGVVMNTATVYSDETSEKTASSTFGLVRDPQLTIDKKVSAIDLTGNSLADKANDIVTFKIFVTNTGNVDLTGVTVSDPNADPESLERIGGPDDILKIGETWEYQSTYTLKQADLDNNGGGDGKINNLATAYSDQTAPVSDPADFGLIYQPLVTLDKTITGVSGTDGNTLADHAGDVIHYQMIVENTGNVTLTNVSLTDSFASNVLRVADVNGDNDGLLEVGEIWKYTASHTILQAEFDQYGYDINGDKINDGVIANTATLETDQTSEVSDSTTQGLSFIPALAIDKTVVSVSGSDGNALLDNEGDVIQYSISVSNNGNVALSNVLVKDSLTGLSEIIAVLNPGQSVVYNNTDTDYVLTALDLSTNGGGDGDIDNTATASFSFMGVDQVESDSTAVGLVGVPVPV